MRARHSSALSALSTNGRVNLVEVDAFELRQQAVPENLRRDAGAVGNEEPRCAADS